MNTELPFIPERPAKPRHNGITMVMDKGLGLRETENFCEANAEFTDFVKLGFGTALITKNLDEKIKIYKSAGIIPYFGGTLFEIYVIRNLFDDYQRFLDKYNLEMTEVSDGSMELEHEIKLDHIRKLSSRLTVLSEVGSKQAGVIIPHEKWIANMKTELEAGAFKVIAEARESGTIGIYRADGTADKDLINDIVKHVNSESILWEAPNKNQQVYFIKLAGPNVNLGNIAPAEVIPLEALRCGLRGDTFFEYLPLELKQDQ